jgi:phage-related protein
MTYLAFDDIKLDWATQSKRSVRVQRVQFGDGYSQIQTDGLNSNLEQWRCRSALLTYEEAQSIESYLLSLHGQAITWTPPLNTKTFSRPITSGQLDLGYTNISTISLDGYSRPTDYTVNLATGLITSVTIANGTVVEVTLTLEARTFLLDDGWNFELVTAGYCHLDFGLTRVYV